MLSRLNINKSMTQDSKLCEEVTGSLLTVTQRMLDHAVAGEWDVVSSLREARDEQIRQLRFSANAQADIIRLLDLDREILVLADQYKRTLAAELKQLDKAKNAVSAYTTRSTL